MNATPAVDAAARNPTPEPRAAAGDLLLDDLLQGFARIRRFSEELAAPLAPEDCVVQTMPDVSPTKWHLAHTSWFFDTFLLQPFAEGFRPLAREYAYLFNSYYNAAGPMHCRDRRGFISRPTMRETMEYRRYVDHHVVDMLQRANAATLPQVLPIVVLGLHHEQQHQELLLTDIKHVFAQNPLHPVYAAPRPGPAPATTPSHWRDYDAGLAWIGAEADAGFSFDNERPRHREYLEPFALADRLVTNGEYRRFIEDDGYRRPELWLSLGWATVRQQDWQAPLYWQLEDGAWHEFTLGGFHPLAESAPVCHVSFFEADAYARWAGARLPTEGEWETAAAPVAIAGNFVGEGRFHPAPAAPMDGPSLRQMFGDVWEWTRSSYSPYPGYTPASGALGEYNGKFMCNQMTLRGGSCATAESHIRPTYRNFFPPEKRWQFTGIRLAQDRA